MQETWAQFLGREDPLEEGMATHSSILAWRVPGTEEPGGPQSLGSQKSTRVSTIVLSSFHAGFVEDPRSGLVCCCSCLRGVYRQGGKTTEGSVLLTLSHQGTRSLLSTRWIPGGWCPVCQLLLRPCFLYCILCGEVTLDSPRAMGRESCSASLVGIRRRGISIHHLELLWACAKHFNINVSLNPRHGPYPRAACERMGRRW